MARFIVAPDGYGKTSVAVEYAETVFAWAHVFWVNCQSPCFIRDLDAEDIAQSVLKSDSDARLVVFDDVPVLDASRADAMSDVLDELLQESCEVMVNCAPASDVFGGLQRDQQRLSARDLLLEDDEVDALRSSDERARVPAANLPASQRVAQLAWGEKQSAPVAFLKSALTQDMPDDLRLAMCGMYVLGKGNLVDLEQFGPVDIDSMADILEAYPHMCFDVETGRFETPLLPVDGISRACKRGFEGMVGRSAFESRRELSAAWADALMEAGCPDRACDVMRVLCPAHGRAEWVAEHSLELVEEGCFFASLQLVGSVMGTSTRMRNGRRAAVEALGALCLRVLGDFDAAERWAKRVAFEEDCPLDARLCCLLIVARGSTAKLRKRACAVLGEMATGKLGSAISADSHEPLAERLRFFAWAAHGQCSFADGPEALVAFWEQAERDGAPRRALDLVASWIFDAIDRGAEGTDGSTVAAAAGRAGLERHVRSSLEDADASRPDYFALSAGLAMEQAHAHGMRYQLGPMPASLLITLRNAEMCLLSQRRLFEDSERNERIRKNSWADTHPGSLTSTRQAPLSVAERRSVPTLAIHLFGRFEVSIGDGPLKEDLLKRKSLCLLLAVLALNRGHEVSRDSLAASLWPKSKPELARKNYYTVWAQLRKALSLPDGTCPYLVRHQYGCSLDVRYVRTDAMRLDQICRELMFSRPDLLEWPALYVELDRDFSSDLMPATRSNDLIDIERTRYRARLIEALLSASRGMVEAGDPQWGIWFARSAVQHDHLREDAYVALMRAQVAANQRAAAVLTFMDCRNALVTELGIDPSAETLALYQEIIESS